MALAGLIVATGKGEPLAVAGQGFAGLAAPIGLAALAALTAGIYRGIAGAAKPAG